MAFKWTQDGLIVNVFKLWPKPKVVLDHLKFPQIQIRVGLDDVAVDFHHNIATIHISLHVFKVAQILVIVGNDLVGDDLLLAILNLIVRWVKVKTCAHKAIFHHELSHILQVADFFWSLGVLYVINDGKVAHTDLQQLFVEAYFTFDSSRLLHRHVGQSHFFDHHILLVMLADDVLQSESMGLAKLYAIFRMTI